MKLLWLKFVYLLVITLALATGALAQDTTPAPLPSAYQLNGFTHIFQGWNNCGPATLTMGLTYFGYAADQQPAANWLKPTPEDGNVSPWQMVDYVNTQLPGTTRALTRVGGTLDLIKTLLVNGFPVIIEEGYDPEPERLGWMGHYLLLIGYDNNQQAFITQDSYLGPNRIYTYDHINRFWRHFNRTYIVLYDDAREVELLILLGSDADEQQNAINALETARGEAVANPEDPFAWFNMGSNFVRLDMYQEAAIAYDQARNVGGGLPWRMLWYQFGTYEAYNAVGRYNDTLALAHTLLNDPGTAQYIEETFYYAGIAREGLGERDRALENYNQALYLNPNFTPASEARDRLLATDD